MKTYSAKPKEVTRTWYIVDASALPLGRLSTAIATKLTGKDKAMFTPHIDCGDYVVVINSDNLVVTGGKLDKKHYHRYSGFPGGLKTRTLKESLTKSSEQVVIHAVRGMLPDNKLRPARLARLKVYAGADHPHTPQNPKPLNVLGKVK